MGAFMAEIYNDNSQLISSSTPDFEKAELDLLRSNLRLSHKERFLMATKLYKIQQTMKRQSLLISLTSANNTYGWIFSMRKY
jgi:hypothetical protein